MAWPNGGRREIEELEVTRVDELRTAGEFGRRTLVVPIAMGILVAVAPAAILSASPPAASGCV